MATVAKKSKTNPVYCASIGCSNTRMKKPHLTFFYFPRDNERSRQWVLNMRRKDLVDKSMEELNRSYSLCEEHFERNQFNNPDDKGSGRGRVHLLPNAVPTLFPTPPPMSSNRKRKIPMKPSEVEELERASEDATELSSEAGELGGTALTKKCAGSVRAKYHTRWCSVFGCSNSKGKNPHLSFFSFPRDKERCKQWVENCRRADLLNKSVEHLSSSNAVCEVHFEASQFNRPEFKGSDTSRKRLIPSALPTFFGSAWKPLWPIEKPGTLIRGLTHRSTPQRECLRNMAKVDRGAKLDEDSEIMAAVRSIIPQLCHSLHKGQAGRIGVVGGCQDYTGAPYFAAISALKVGADLTHVFCASTAGAVIKSYSPELIVHPILDSHDIDEQMATWLPRLHCLVIGPGLGNDETLHGNVVKIIEKTKEMKIPLVLDAEGIRCATSDPSLLRDYTNVILTPNAVEFNTLYKRLMGGSTPDDEQSVSRLSQKLGGATIIQKGVIDVIANDTRLVKCMCAGGPRRCGGQGDLLAGAMAVFLHWSHNSVSNGNSNAAVRKYGPELIAGYGACCLARTCNEIAFQRHGRAMLTSDMIQHIHTTFDALFSDQYE